MDFGNLKRSILKINKNLRNSNSTDAKFNSVTPSINNLDKELNSIVNVFCESKIIKKCYTERTLKIYLHKWISLFIKQEQKDFFDNLDNNIQKLIKELETKPQSPISYFIIINYLNTEIDFAIGDIKIIGHSSNEIKRLSDKFDSNLNAPNVNVNQYVSSLFKGRVNIGISLALYETNGIEVEQIKTIGLDQIKLIINIVRLFYFYKKGSTLSQSFNYFGISGFTFNKGQFIDYVTSYEKSNIEIKNPVSIPFTIDAKFFDDVQHYVNTLSDILKSDSNNELERLLVNSVDFFGEGVNDFIHKYSFLNFFISVEILLLRIKETNITTNLCTRIALILGKGTQEKQSIYEDIEYLYNIRSALVHKGADNITYSELLLLGKYAIKVILEILNYRLYFSDQESLLKEIEKISFTSTDNLASTIKRDKFKI